MDPYWSLTIRPYDLGLSKTMETTVKSLPISSCAFKILSVNLISIKGISPGRIKVTPSLSSKIGAADNAAWPVPSCSICSAY